MPTSNTRIEHDLLGDLAVPADACYGVQTAPQTLLVNGARTLREFCVEGITANPEVCKHYLESSLGTVTALNPVIGYDKSTELAAEALKSGEGILELIREKHILTDAQIDEILNPAALTGQGL